MLTVQTSSVPALSSEGASQTRAAAVLEQPPGREITAHVDDTGLYAVERFVAVVGPPAVGKSTVTRTLADHLGAQVFRLREFAHEFRSHGTVDERLFDTGDSPDWLSEETVFLLLQAAFIQGQFQTCGLVVLENFPESLTQLLLLKATADHRVDATCDPETCLQSVVTALAATEP